MQSLLLGVKRRKSARVLPASGLVHRSRMRHVEEFRHPLCSVHVALCRRRHAGTQGDTFCGDPLGRRDEASRPDRAPDDGRCLRWSSALAGFLCPLPLASRYAALRTGYCGKAVAAARLVESLTSQAPGFVPLVVVVKLAWVLSSTYELTRAQLAEALEALLCTKKIVVERADTVWKALRVFKAANADFADCLIERSVVGQGTERTMTFDRGAMKGCGTTPAG